MVANRHHELGELVCSIGVEQHVLRVLAYVQDTNELAIMIDRHAQNRLGMLKISVVPTDFVAIATVDLRYLVPLIINPAVHREKRIVDVFRLARCGNAGRAREVGVMIVLIEFVFQREWKAHLLNLRRFSIGRARGDGQLVLQQKNARASSQRDLVILIVQEEVVMHVPHLTGVLIRPIARRGLGRLLNFSLSFV